MQLSLPFCFIFLSTHIFFLFLVTSLFLSLLHICVNALCPGNEYRLTARALDSRVVRPTLIGFGYAKRRSTYRSFSFISFTWIIAAVTAAIAAYLQATSTRVPIAYRTRRGIYRGCYFVVDSIDERLMSLCDVDRWSDFASEYDEIRERERDREIISIRIVWSLKSPARREKISRTLFSNRARAYTYRSSNRDEYLMRIRNAVSVNFCLV